MKLGRALVHTLIILAVATIGASIATRGFAIVLHHLSFGSFLPFALATAAAMNNQKGLLIATAGVTVLAIIPCSIQLLAHAVLPIGIGVLLGTGVQRAIRETTEQPS